MIDKAISYGLSGLALVLGIGLLFNGFVLVGIITIGMSFGLFKILRDSAN